MKTAMFDNLVLGSALLGSLLMSAGGCSTEEALHADSMGSTGHALLLLGDSQRPGTAIEGIAERFQVVSDADLGLAAGQAATAEDARQRIAGMRGVAVNLATASDADMQFWAPIFTAALDTGVPLIIENAADSERLSQIMGIGFDADLMVVTATGNRRHVQVFGGNAVIKQHFADNGEEYPEALYPAAQDDIEMAIQTVSEELLAHTPRMAPKSATTYLYYYFDFSTYSWALSSTQTATLNLDFEAQLVGDELKDKKFVIFSQAGGGHHPGTLDDDYNRNRGYFQESASVSIVPTTNGTNVELYAHAPSTTNNSSSYASTTGWGIDASAGTDGASTTLSYNSSTTVTTTLSDFTAINNTSGTTAGWTFELNAVSGHSYDSWADLVYWDTFEKCKLYSLPDLAKSNLTPEFEAIYIADDSYTGTVTFQLQTISLMRDTWVSGDIFTCKKSTNWQTLTRTMTVSINFNSVTT